MVGGAPHPDVDVEHHSGHQAQHCEDYAPDKQSRFLAHLYIIILPSYYINYLSEGQTQIFLFLGPGTYSCDTLEASLLRPSSLFLCDCPWGFHSWYSIYPQPLYPSKAHLSGS